MLKSSLRKRELGEESLKTLEDDKHGCRPVIPGFGRQTDFFEFEASLEHTVSSRLAIDIQWGHASNNRCVCVCVCVCMEQTVRQ